MIQQKKFGDMTKEEQAEEINGLMSLVHLMLPNDAYPILILVAVPNKDGAGGNVISAVNGPRGLLLESMEKIMEQIKAAETYPWQDG